MKVKDVYKREYAEYFKETLTKLMAAPSPSGYHREVNALLKERVEKENARCVFSPKGTCEVRVEGKGGAAVGLSAHCDTLGLMVRSVSPSGEIMFVTVGGIILPTLDGEYCTVRTRDGRSYTGTVLSRSPAIHVFNDCTSRKRDEKNMYVRLDERVRCADDVRKLGIRNGDYIFVDTKTAFTGSGFVKSRFLDDKAGAAELLTALHILTEEGIAPEKTVKMFFTVFEEVGHGASGIDVSGLESFVAVDMGCVGDDLSCTEETVSICAKDRSGPYDYDLTGKLAELCEKHGINYAIDIYPHYSSDVSAMRTAGADVAGALIGPGVQASHGMERTHLDGVFNTIKLILAYIGALD